MTNKPVQLIIVSDLDGSLLDHHDYNFEPARPLLKQLAQADIPVVLCTSKTRAEVQTLRKTLHNHSPFIVENGAAVYLPKVQFPFQPEGSEDASGYWRKAFCEKREHWLSLLEEAKIHFVDKFDHFSAMSEARVAELTGLPLEQAAQAKAREFGEPLQWLGSEEDLAAFTNWFQERGACILSGGRFVHVAGDADKGRAMTWLVNEYREQRERILQSQHRQVKSQHHHPRFLQRIQDQYDSLFQQHKACQVKSLALGDSQNDVAMLEASDLAVVIRSPVHAPPVLKREEGVIVSEQEGPAGWAEGVKHWLSDLHLDRQVLPSEEIARQAR
ncbi:HAD-IIB family hydrolase [Pseudomaricurvus sp.]|uniref:HAD-IIB family hydrolase n=1 Tax=Pseudomaricurvus sp. TaxID=2004510 RepID=UPI003F6CEED3